MDNIESILMQSKAVQFNKSRSDRKAKGVFYTPIEVIDYMVEESLGNIDLVTDPYVKILDPACGTGLFLIKAFQILIQKFEADYDKILSSNKNLENKLLKDDLGKFVVENNLWGTDIDSDALNIAKNCLLELAGEECRTNLLCCDSLVGSEQRQMSLFDEVSRQEQEFWNNDFDYIIGNPPYIGHKEVSNEYKKILQRLYTGIYADKSDISYCFIKRGIDLLRDGGILCFIISRYFMEGPSAAGLRRYINENCTVTDIVDFHGRQIFKDAGVAVCIITLSKGLEPSDTRVAKYVQKAKAADSENLFNMDSFENFIIKRHYLKNEGWVLLNPEKYEIFSIMESRGTHTLGELFESYQGIISGCDKAFILDSGSVEEYRIEKSLLKPWIKNSNIKKFAIKPPEKYIIYSELIKDEKDFPNAIKFIGQHKEKLIKRRECEKGIRKWYELQWGRKSEVFEAPKIIYPFKSASNRFAVDDCGYYCSADVYSLQLKGNYMNLLTLEYVTAILNSKLFEFYFKCYAKKISSNLYDYYPNTVLRLKLITGDMNPYILVLTGALKSCKKEEEKKYIIDLIDREVYKLYGISDKQTSIIEQEEF